MPDPRQLLLDARRVVVLTGAGISAESGVPTFRGEQGLWRNFRPEELATPEAFARDPRTVWEWYHWRRHLVAQCVPNAAHHALVEFALDRPGVRLVTQNVDGLHARAAYDVAALRDPTPALPLELHGNLFRDRCTSCDEHGDHDLELGDEGSEDTADLPSCSACGSLLRPDVVWFGEMLDPAVLGEAQRLAAEAEVCLVIGTSAVVHPAAGLANETKRRGGRVIEVNPEETPLSAIADCCVRSSATEAIPEICRV